jgi:hypothetical protein
VWSLEEALWSAADGFPETGSFFQDRFWLGSGIRPAGSKVGDYENFGIGVLDDDAVLFAINNSQINALRWMAGITGRRLLLGTAGAEHTVTGGNDSPITATNIQLDDATTYGSSTVPPLRVGNVILFLTRSGKKLRELTFNFEIDGYVAPDLLLLSDHLTADSAIVDMAFQREPDSRVWAVRADGAGLACTYLRDQNIVAWARAITGPDQPATTPDCGKFESFAVIPHPNGDREQTWALTARKINGSLKRFVEYFEDCSMFEDVNGVSYGSLQTDCAVTYNGASTTTITGLSHLNGETVKVLGDGAVYPDAVVSGGSITISPAAEKVEVGLGFNSKLTTMRPEVPMGAGSSQPLKRSWGKVTVRLLNSLGLTINDVLLPFRTTDHVMGGPPALFTGDTDDVHNLGYDAGQITIEQTQPLPSTILLITGTLVVHEQ